jgi:hypothetical protein
LDSTRGYVQSNGSDIAPAKHFGLASKTLSISTQASVLSKSGLPKMNKLIIKKLAVVAITLATAASMTRAFAQTSQVEQSSTMHLAQGAQPNSGMSDMATHCTSMMRHTKLEVTPSAEASPQSWRAPTSQDNMPSVEKTRAQVQAELLQAEEAGAIPVRSPDYPPSARTIERNRVRFAIIERAWHGQSNVNSQ